MVKGEKWCFLALCQLNNGKQRKGRRQRKTTEWTETTENNGKDGKDGKGDGRERSWGWT